MPTGYTAKLYEGTDQSFEEFVLGCARAFGALILIRDDPADAPIPDEFTPDTDYYEKSMERDRAALDKAVAWTPDEAEQAAASAFAEKLAAWEQSQIRAAEIRTRYKDMLAAVEAWKPPTTEHVKFKEFMADQLQTSIKFDCGGYPAPERDTGADFKAATIARLTRSIGIDEQQIREEIERTEGRNAWVRALRDSLSVSA